MTSTKQNTIDDCWNRIGVWGKGIERCPELGRMIHCRNCSVYSSVGRSLLSRAQSPEYLEEWTSIMAREKHKEHPGSKSAFVFRAGREWLALPASLIREVVDMGAIHTLPHLSTNILRGLVNVKGKLQICVSIGAVLGIERDETPMERTGFVTPERLVVVDHKGTVIAFPVTEILGVVRYRPDMLRDPPVTVSGSKAVYTTGILCLGDKDIGFLKVKPLFQTLTRDLL